MSVVVIAEDNPGIQFLLKEVVADLGYQSRAYDDGQRCLEGLLTLPPPALVILDLNLPGLSGQAILSNLRSNPATVQIPVLIVSGQVGSWPTTSTELFLAKPFTLEDLEEAINKLMRKQARA